MARDAAEMSPKLIPDDSLLPRDNSGGIDAPDELIYTQKWDDGGRITGGPKPHLSTSDSGASSERKPYGKSGKRSD